MIKILTLEEQDSLHHRYRNSDLFRHWSPLLCRLEWEMQEVDMMTLWWEAEKVLQRIREEIEHRDEMIPYILKRLIKEFRTVENEFGEKIIRTIEQAECSAVTVMSIVLTQLMNAVEEGHEEESFDNQPMCVAAMAWLRSHPHFQFLMNDFFKRTRGNDGKKVVIRSSDPMNSRARFENMDEPLQQEVTAIREKVLDITGTLKGMFGDFWAYWENLCEDVCMDHELFKLLKMKMPNGNEWGLNQKMVCNMLGLFCQKTDVEVSINAVNKAISDKQLSSYLRNHAAYGTNDCVLDRTQHQKIENKIIGFLSDNG